MADGDYIRERTHFLAEIWVGFRPHLIRLATDFLVFLLVWLLLTAAHWLTSRLPVGTTMSRFLAGFHETVVVLTFVWLSLEAAWDIIALRRAK